MIDVARYGKVRSKPKNLLRPGDSYEENFSLNQRVRDVTLFSDRG